MFYCDTCALQNELPILYTKEYGDCQICKHSDCCSDNPEISSLSKHFNLGDSFLPKHIDCSFVIIF